MRDYMNRIDLRRVLSPAAAGTDNTAMVGQIVDGLGYDGVIYAINLGVNTDINATFTVLLEHGDVANMSDAAAVPDAQLTGTEILAAFTAAADDNKLKKLGYVGNKRYTRLTITPAANDSGNIFVTALAILCGGRFSPAANPPS